MAPPLYQQPLTTTYPDHYYLQQQSAAAAAVAAVATPATAYHDRSPNRCSNSTCQKRSNHAHCVTTPNIQAQGQFRDKSRIEKWLVKCRDAMGHAR